MTEDPTIALYESVTDITGQMLAAARNSDWEGLCALEMDCASLVRKLQGLESTASSENGSQLTGAIGLRKRTLIEKKITDDREICSLTESRMAQLSSLLNRPRVERQLSMAYGGRQTPYN